MWCEIPSCPRFTVNHHMLFILCPMAIFRQKWSSNTLNIVTYECLTHKYTFNLFRKVNSKIKDHGIELILLHENWVPISIFFDKKWLCCLIKLSLRGIVNGWICTKSVSSQMTQARGWYFVPLQWRHNGRDGVSYHQLHDCLLNRLFRRR